MENSVYPDQLQLASVAFTLLSKEALWGSTWLGLMLRVLHFRGEKHCIGWVCDHVKFKHICSASETTCNFAVTQKTVFVVFDQVRSNPAF